MNYPPVFTTDLRQTNESKPALPGFDPKYTDIVDYILKITHEIWEERGIGVIYDTYTEGITLHAGAGISHGINAIVSGTLETLQAFPDRRLVGEAVIWSAEQQIKFYTSHRIGSTATNLGTSAFGPPTGKRAFFRTIADCVVSANKIEEEWLVRDNLHLIQQLGYDPVALAKASTKYRSSGQAAPLAAVPFIAENRIGQQLPPVTTAATDSATQLCNLFQAVWNGRRFQEVDHYYHPTATVHSICDQVYRGTDQIQSFLVNLFAAVPQASVQVERVTSNTDAHQDTVAVRWRLTGLHQGNGFFGRPTGRPINMLGISHFVLSDGKIEQQWDVFDAFDVLCQIHANAPMETSAVPAPSAMPALNDVNKTLVASLVADLNDAIASKQGVPAVLNRYFAPAVSWNGSKPFDELTGTAALYEQFWQPLLQAFPDLEDQPYILMGGHFNDRDWVSLTGNYVGTFENDWLDIPATQQATWIRYGVFYEIKDEKIQTAYCILDMLDVMGQAGIHLFPNRAPEITINGPMSYDGILTGKIDPEAGRKSLQLTEDMIRALGNFDGVNLHTMQMDKFWHPNMMWYGPAGTGSTRGLKGFQEYHQKPFLVGFPDRKGGHHKARFGDGAYSCSTGWPSIYATHGGNDWMGIDATHRKITMRVMDWWRREGDLLRENWVFIDKIDLLDQLGISVFDLLKTSLTDGTNRLDNRRSVLLRHTGHWDTAQ